MLPAASLMWLVEQPCAKDWIHVDGDALDADQQYSTWTYRGEKSKKLDRIQKHIVQFFEKQKHNTRGYAVHLYCLNKINMTVSKQLFDQHK